MRSCASTRTSLGTRSICCQPLYNLLLMGFFEWGVALHDLNWDAIGTGEKSKAQVISELKASA